MKISITDECQGKFSDVLKDHWEQQGHEVWFDKYFDPKKILWADVAFFDWAGNNVQRASYPEDDFWKETGQPQDKNIILRIHDIDYWAGSAGRVNYPWINNLVFVAKHIQNKVLSEITLTDKTKVHFIKHGVDTTKFTFSDRFPERKIAWVGNINDPKKLETALLVLADLPRDYSLHVVGKGLISWRKAYVEYFIKQNNLNVEFIESVDSMNDFLEDKDFFLYTSVKEAFGFSPAEAMSKGVKSLIHNYYGADVVWKDYPYVWNTVAQATQMIMETIYMPTYLEAKQSYRRYIEDNYPYQAMLDKYDELLLNK